MAASAYDEAGSWCFYFWILAKNTSSLNSRTHLDLSN